jgi:hypothetical protein
MMSDLDIITQLKNGNHLEKNELKRAKEIVNHLLLELNSRNKIDKPIVDKSKWTGSGYCINSNVVCDMLCEKCIYNKPKNEIQIKKIKPQESVWGK